MTAECFLDTNILLYACSGAKADKTTRTIAEDLILNAHFGLSVQVLQEFIANALRKPSLGISETNIDATLKLATHVPVVPMTLELIQYGIAVRRRYKLGHRDATIIAAANALTCHTLYTEDLNHGQAIGDVQIVNPFKQQRRLTSAPKERANHPPKTDLKKTYPRHPCHPWSKKDGKTFLLWFSRSK